MRSPMTYVAILGTVANTDQPTGTYRFRYRPPSQDVRPSTPAGMETLLLGPSAPSAAYA